MLRNALPIIYGSLKGLRKVIWYIVRCISMLRQAPSLLPEDHAQSGWNNEQTISSQTARTKDPSLPLNSNSACKHLYHDVLLILLMYRCCLESSMARKYCLLLLQRCIPCCLSRAFWWCTNNHAKQWCYCICSYCQGACRVTAISRLPCLVNRHPHFSACCASTSHHQLKTRFPT